MSHDPATSNSRTQKPKEERCGGILANMGFRSLEFEEVTKEVPDISPDTSVGHLFHTHPTTEECHEDNRIHWIWFDRSYGRTSSNRRGIQRSDKQFARTPHAVAADSSAGAKRAGCHRLSHCVARLSLRRAITTSSATGSLNSSTVGRSQPRRFCRIECRRRR